MSIGLIELFNILYNEERKKLTIIPDADADFIALYNANNRLAEINNKTIEEATTDYDYGFYTSHDGDLHAVLVGVDCNRCGKEHFEYKLKDKLANIYCDKCRGEKL